MIRILCICFLALVPGPTLAQQAAVRSGEHEGFSRLVIPIAQGTGWTQAGAGREVVLTFDPGSGPFDISGVFERIPRDRLQEMGQDGDRLTLELACDCPVTAFLHDRRFVVVDIADPVIDAPAQPVEQAGPVPIPADGPLRSAEPSLLNQTFPVLDRDAVPPLLPTGDVRNAASMDMTVLADLIGAELSRATAAGLLDPAVPYPVGADGQPVVTAAPATAPAGSLPLTVRTAADADTAPLRDAADCPAPAQLDVGEWGHEGGFAAGLSTYRVAVFDERDRPDQGAIRRLARFYVHHGFGAEAGYWLSLLQDPPIIETALAAFFADNPEPLFEALAAYGGCAGDIVMWRVAAGDAAPLAQPQGRADVVAAFNAAPLSLRTLLRPALARNLVEAGAQDILAELDASLARGRAANAAEDPLHPPSPTRGDIAEALIVQLRQAERADTEMLDAAEGLWRELGLVPESEALVLELTAATARQGDVARAVRLHDELADASPVLARRAATALVRELAEANEAAALEIISVAGLELGRGEAADAARLAAGRTLAAAGFADTALDFLQAIPPPRGAEVEALMTDLIFDPSNPQTGNAEPQLAAPGPDDPEDRLTEAWQSGAWEVVARAGTGARAEAAAALLTSPSFPADPQFEDMNQALNESVDLRALVGELLSYDVEPLGN